MKRSFREIKLEVLRQIEKDPCRTHVMYASNINWWLLNRVLTDLVQSGLLNIYNTKPKKVGRPLDTDSYLDIYLEITEKGLEVLKASQELQSKLRGEG